VARLSIAIRGFALKGRMVKPLIALTLASFIATSVEAMPHGKHQAPVRAVSVQKDVPVGMYVRSENPSCGIPTTLASLGKDKKVVKAVGKAMGPKVASVVILVNKADEVAESSGGDLAGLWNKVTGKRDGASCAAMCVRLPTGARPKTVQLSDRHGAGGLAKRFVNGSIEVNATTGDYSGWRDVVSTKSDGRWFVCGTGTNWSGDQTARKRLAVTY